MFATPMVIVTTNGDTAEALADYATRRIIGIAETAHPAIRDQAHAFRKEINELLLMCMKEAAKRERASLGLGN